MSKEKVLQIIEDYKDVPIKGENNLVLSDAFSRINPLVYLEKIDGVCHHEVHTTLLKIFSWNGIDIEEVEQLDQTSYKHSYIKHESSKNSGNSCIFHFKKSTGWLASFTIVSVLDIIFIEGTLRYKNDEFRETKPGPQPIKLIERLTDKLSE